MAEPSGRIGSGGGGPPTPAEQVLIVRERCSERVSGLYTSQPPAYARFTTSEQRAPLPVTDTDGEDQAGSPRNGGSPFVRSATTAMRRLEGESSAAWLHSVSGVKSFPCRSLTLPSLRPRRQTAEQVRLDRIEKGGCSLSFVRNTFTTIAHDSRRLTTKKRPWMHRPRAR